MRKHINYLVGHVNPDNGSIFQSHIDGETETVTLSRTVYERACARADDAIQKALIQIRADVEQYIHQTATKSSLQ